MGTRAGERSAAVGGGGADSGEKQRLKVLYDFEYETRGKRVKIVKDERLVLLRKTNDDWWQVVRAADLAGSFYVPEQSTFYVPTGYVAHLQRDDQLPEGTRFYVDKDNETAPPRDKLSQDSFKSKVIRKLSGNLTQQQQQQHSSSKASRIVKHLRKNSDDSSGKDGWESSAFGMCFGRDIKNSDAAHSVLNPFQEELENALSNRLSQRKIAPYRLASRAKPSDPTDQLPDTANREPATFGSIHDKWQKASHGQSLLARKANDKAQPAPKQPSLRTDDRSESVVGRDAAAERKRSTRRQTGRESEDVDVINDKRKMWAIETLMSELMQSCSMSARTAASSEANDAKVSGAKQLAQELHEMNASRRFENAEIQVDLLDDEPREHAKDQVEAEPEVEEEEEEEGEERRVFDFGRQAIAPASANARSPKLLDEYNEANILSDGGKRTREESLESPSYSTVSLCIRRENVPSQLTMPGKVDFGDELQLTPSLEKLASEIKFLPASWKSAASPTDNDKLAPEADWPTTTTLSQDSLRLYKRRSKSEPQLLLAEAMRQQPERKYAQYEHQRHSLRQQPEQLTPPTPPSTQQQHSHHYQQSQHHHQYHHTSKYKLQRKSRSLGDLDCSEMDEREQIELRRRYKPVPKLRSKDSFKRLHKANLLVSVSDSASTKPVPAKRRIQQQQQTQLANSSCDDLSQLDIERSTAVGFKSLLRASDSGSEECLQSKTFPSLSSLLLLNKPNHQYRYEQQHQQQNNSNDNLSSSRSLSSETILSSASTSSVGPTSARILDEPNLENLVELPPGWRQTYDANAKRFCFVNDRGDKWFSSNDTEGKIYFFEENSNESSWALPAITDENRVRTISNGDWPQLFDGNMCILKEGMINKTKITSENGKKLRKAWSLSYAVLTELFLLFFKDAKTFATMKMDQSAAAKPDITVDLNGAFIEPADKLSNRKNVYLINTLLGLQVLVQSDNVLAIMEWYEEINEAIRRLPFSQKCRRSSSSK